MDVAVDAARQHQLAGGVDDLLRRAEIVAERRDPAVRDADVAGEGVGGGRNGAAADDGVEGHAAIPIRPVLEHDPEKCEAVSDDIMPRAESERDWQTRRLPVVSALGGAGLGQSDLCGLAPGASVGARSAILAGSFGLSARLPAAACCRQPLPPAGFRLAASALGQQLAALRLGRRDPCLRRRAALAAATRAVSMIFAPAARAAPRPWPAPLRATDRRRPRRVRVTAGSPPARSGSLRSIAPARGR